MLRPMYKAAITSDANADQKVSRRAVSNSSLIESRLLISARDQSGMMKTRSLPYPAVADREAVNPEVKPNWWGHVGLVASAPPIGGLQRFRVNAAYSPRSASSTAR